MIISSVLHPRVWMELSHDMVTTFRSSDDHARVRPLRTVLCACHFSSYPNLSILYYIDDHTLTYFTRSPTITQYPPFARSIRLTPAIRGALRLILRLQ